MLVYGNNISFLPPHGPVDIIRFLARWMGRKAGVHVDADRLAAGIVDLVLPNKMHVHSRTTASAGKPLDYPYLFCAQLSHPDDSVSGRRWVTEVGLRQLSAGGAVECSFILRTDELSARVTTPIRVTRPVLIDQLVKNCNPLSNTPGTKVKVLDESSAAAFLSTVEHPNRSSPILLVSPTREGVYLVSPERIRSLLVGIADVVALHPEADSYLLDAVIGRRFFAFGGAVNLIFPKRNGHSGGFYETVRIKVDQMDAWTEDGIDTETEILSAVTHRTNLPNSWRHISMEAVGQARLRLQLAQTLSSHNSGDASKEQIETFIALLQEADKDIDAKTLEITGLHYDLEQKEMERLRLESLNEGLRYALSGRQASADAAPTDVHSSLLPFREIMSTIIEDEPSLEQSLTIISSLYPDRVAVLDSAIQSAVVSDDSGFRMKRKALELLWSFVTTYWQALADGRGDQYAKQAFGAFAYANNEGEALSAAGRRRRTFTYQGQDLLMIKHLKIGVKESDAETLRVHFEWVASSKRLVIGHCGGHLDF